MEPDYRNILKQYFGYDDFRGIQKEIIESIGAGHDTLGLMPTGGGKSITFQVPALSMPGICIVITPLISLMKDQVDHLRQRGITAYAIYSGLSHNDVVKILDNCIYGKIKFLYVSPERLSSYIFLAKLRHINVSFIAIDEAHCISQWGYDFRPAYLRISELRALLPGKAVLALTATATPSVVKDIQKQLAFTDGNVFRMSFRRDNISYIVRHTMDRRAEILHILNNVEGSTIIYANSRKATKELSIMLNDAGISATFFHAGLDIAVKTKRQHDWHSGAVRVIVATNAFGMGIDKPDVRLVIHADVPSSLEAYFQEAGRAGRDGKLSYSVLLKMRNTPISLRRRIIQYFPDKTFIRKVYERLAYYYEIGVGMGEGLSVIFPLDKFCIVYHYSTYSVDAALHILDNAGYISYDTTPDDNSRVKFIVPREELYRLRTLPEEEDVVIDAMMRTYPGLFSDFIYVDLRAIAYLCSSTVQRVYTLLKDLRHRGIIEFVPPRTDPRLTFLVNRVDECNVHIPKEAYDYLRDTMVDHIDSMLQYLNCDVICRQQQLIRYFGEESNYECGKCEVCIDKKKKPKDPPVEIKKAILDLLSDGNGHYMNEISKLPYPRDLIYGAITELLENNDITSDGITVKIG
ncbi:MAG: RecQ family ATP-dependent DNA helicase [Bacteroidales bacterium]|nr:RecQ family ATP-dependent DNA helicase [Bacteroidales bacterium]MCM1147424.1 RecQ family ATP-dependent DNA helicase [Bacteroidales bacterium]MCM1206093.1 RecQ family ATP-dependent DNA helicase [Bacillota bacterium]MCM1510076.1 RecQ family ATP-dependent DNA helicase [Clostridium sp.]